MKKAYLILAHKNLNQLIRLLDRLDDGNSHFFVHIDLKTPLSPVDEAVSSRANVVIVKRIATQWAGFSLAAATLKTMQAARDSGIDFQFISLLSGQDYPVKSNAEIDQYLSSSSYGIFLDFFPLPNYQRWAAGGTYRYKKYFFGTSPIAMFFSRACNLLSTLIPVFARKLPFHLRPYCGSQWWTINLYAHNYILDYINRNPEYLHFHKCTFAPDELFFHIILLNAKDERISAGILNNNLRYIKWNRLDDPHPETLTHEDLPDLKTTRSLFARKFDELEDHRILDLIDEQLLTRGPK